MAFCRPINFFSLFSRQKDRQTGSCRSFSTEGLGKCAHWCTSIRRQFRSCALWAPGRELFCPGKQHQAFFPLCGPKIPWSFDCGHALLGTGFRYPCFAVRRPDPPSPRLCLATCHRFSETEKFTRIHFRCTVERRRPGSRLELG